VIGLILGSSIAADQVLERAAWRRLASMRSPHLVSLVWLLI
jgi:hypothetical protein